MTRMALNQSHNGLLAGQGRGSSRGCRANAGPSHQGGNLGIAQEYEKLAQRAGETINRNGMLGAAINPPVASGAATSLFIFRV